MYSTFHIIIIKNKQYLIMKKMLLTAIRYYYYTHKIMLTHWVMLITSPSPSPSHGPGGQPFSQCSTILNIQYQLWLLFSRLLSHLCSVIDVPRQIRHGRRTQGSLFEDAMTTTGTDALSRHLAHPLATHTVRGRVLVRRGQSEGGGQWEESVTLFLVCFDDCRVCGPKGMRAEQLLHFHTILRGQTGI